VVRKEPNPTWVPPPSIHAENPDLPASVGPGPDNPLGAFALRLGWSNYLIHGTNKPDGIGRNVSHGCIHLYPEDIEKLFKSVAVGTPVRAVEQPGAAAWIGIGLYLEVHPSKDQADQIDTEQPMVPAQASGLREAVSGIAGASADSVDWNAVGQAALQRTGLPAEIAQRPPAGEASQPPPSEVAPEVAQSPQLDNGAPPAPAADDEGPQSPYYRAYGPARP
jgi:L,D-transpeptidase ErfK/SrfK